MANPTTIQCLHYLQSKGESNEERQLHFSSAPYVLKAQIISAQRGLKQADVTYVKSVTPLSKEECLKRERELLRQEIDKILETCIYHFYNEEVKKLIIGILKTLPDHPDRLEEVNEAAGEIYKNLSKENVVEESKKLAREIPLEGSVESMRAAMDVFLNQHVAEKLEKLQAQAGSIYEKLSLACNCFAE